MENQRKFEATFNQTTYCAALRGGECPLMSLVEGLRLTEEGFIALLNSRNHNVFKSGSMVTNEKGELHLGEVVARCRRPSRRAPVDCGDLKVTVSSLEPLPRVIR